MTEGFDEEVEVPVSDREGSFMVRVAGRDLATSNGIAVVLHGGGFTGMSWAPAAGIMKSECCVIAPDLRGHGLTKTSTSSRCYPGGDGSDLSLDTLAEDVTSLLVEILTNGLLGRGYRRPNHGRKDGDESVGDTTARKSLGENGATEPFATEELQAESAPNATAKSDPNGRDHLRHERGLEGVRRGSDSGASGTDGVTSSARDKPGEQDCGSDKRNSDSASFGGGGQGETLRVLLVGHSLGGSIAVRVAAAAEDFKRRCRGSAEIAGVVAVDVVGGTALAALDDMPEVLSKIPEHFPSVEDAVSWHVKTGAVRDSASAAVVVPSRLKDDGEIPRRVVWRTDLRSTERCWRGWFEGMSEAFLALAVPKLLMVAGMDRLDTELTAAHMQEGEFQLKLVYGCGHNVQEDQPRETAASILNFAARNYIFRRGTSGATDGRRREEDDDLRKKIARAREQAFGKASTS
ncbi:unnamed protein product [Ascophyllum nodosum]